MSNGSIFSSCSLRYTRHWPKVGVIMGAYVAALLTLTTSGQLQNKASSFSLLPYGIVGDGKPQISHNLDWNPTSSWSAWEKQKVSERNTFPIDSVRCISSISSDHKVQAETEKWCLCMFCKSNGHIHKFLSLDSYQDFNAPSNRNHFDLYMKRQRYRRTILWVLYLILTFYRALILKFWFWQVDNYFKSWTITNKWLNILSYFV